MLTRSQTDGRGGAISFGGDRYEDSIVGSLSRAVCSFYARQNLRCLHEVRISEQACAKLADGQYHLFWNGDPTAPEAQLEEMNLLINHFAILNRRALAVPGRERDWLRKNFSGLIDEYQFDYGTWAAMGGSGDPAAAPEAEQDMRAAMLYSSAGSSPWPICG